MNEGNTLDLSIQLEENQEKQKQAYEDFVELTNKIAESDRNNDYLREIKKKKLAQVNKIRMAHCEAEEQKESLKQRHEEVTESLKQEKFMKVKRNQELQELNSKFDHLSKKERVLEEKSNSIGKDNDRLQKQILKMQIQFDDLVRRNKEKEDALTKLRRKKEEQQSQYKDSQNKIIQLEAKCQKSKKNAEILEAELKKQYDINSQLEQTIRDKEEDLKRYRRDREQNMKKQEQIKRTNNKLSQKIKVMEEGIDQKLNQLHRVQAIHERLQRQIEKFVESQRSYEQILLKRHQILVQLKKDCEKAKKVKQYNQS